MQGSNSPGECNDKEWTTLKVHLNDTVLPIGMWSEADWPIEEMDASIVGYRYFRILQTGVDSDGRFGVSCSGIEMYGVLSTNKYPC